MICPKCGTPEATSAAKCEKCGYDLNMFRKMNGMPAVEDKKEEN